MEACVRGWAQGGRRRSRAEVDLPQALVGSGDGVRAWGDGGGPGGNGAYELASARVAMHMLDEGDDLHDGVSR